MIKPVLNLFAILLLLTCLSSCKPDRYKILVCFVDHTLNSGSQKFIRFTDCIEKAISEAGFSEEYGKMKIVIYAIGTDENLKAPVSKTIKTKDEPDFISNPSSFSKSIVSKLTSKWNALVDTNNRTYHILPISEMIQKYWKEVERTDGKGEMKVLIISEMLEQSDAMIGQNSPDRYDFLERNTSNINTGQISKALNDLNNANSSLFLNHIRNYMDGKSDVEVDIHRTGDVNTSSGYEKIEEFWRAFFEKIGIDQENVEFFD